MGVTYLADRLNENGETIESALDHLCVSNDLMDVIKNKKLKDSGTDHVPIMIALKLKCPSPTLNKKTSISCTMLDMVTA